VCHGGGSKYAHDLKRIQHRRGFFKPKTRAATGACRLQHRQDVLGGNRPRLNAKACHRARLRSDEREGVSTAERDAVRKLGNANRCREQLLLDLEDRRYF